MTFAELGLSAALVRATAELGYRSPTPVQSQAIPAILGGADVWASAQTGSGKTAAFALPLLDRLNATPRAAERVARSLVVVPTRELALQIEAALQRYGRHLPRSQTSCVAVGGASIAAQVSALRPGVDVLVGTPGRLLDLARQGELDLGELEICVLDEADRLLSLGFAAELEELLALLPREHQRLLFSATFPPKVRSLADQILRSPTRINVDAGATPSADLIDQRVIEVDSGRRTALLQRLLQTQAWPRALVFVASKAGADELALQLARAGIDAWPLHGDLSLAARTSALDHFKASAIRVLVATDLAARGLDIAQLPAVVNYDLPRSAADYLHRIGRTGRAGERGVAVSFVTAYSASHFRLIEKRHQFRLAREQVPGFEPVEQAPAPRDANGGVKGQRKSKKDKLREAKRNGA
jgi:ATP-dependent RNA helicase RhlE